MFSMQTILKARLSPAPHPALLSMASEIGAACACSPPLMADRMVAALGWAQQVADALAPEQKQASESCYTRRVLYGDPAGRFTILALIWGAGQFSPVHAHRTWCAFAVCESTLTEHE